MQIAATDPKYIGTEENIPDELPPDELPLLKQPFIRDPGQSIQSLVHEAVGKLNENIVVRRFSRFELGA
jgi:elongation factor Ts